MARIELVDDRSPWICFLSQDGLEGRKTWLLRNRCLHRCCWILNIYDIRAETVTMVDQVGEGCLPPETWSCISYAWLYIDIVVFKFGWKSLSSYCDVPVIVQSESIDVLLMRYRWRKWAEDEKDAKNELKLRL
jgi:hypothetical protein